MAAHSFRNQYIQSHSILLKKIVLNDNETITKPFSTRQLNESMSDDENEDERKANFESDDVYKPLETYAQPLRRSQFNGYKNQFQNVVAGNVVDSKEPRHRCNICSEMFTLKAYLKYHMRKNHLNPCPLCKKCFEHERIMRKHIMIEHFDKNEPMKCDDCAERFESVHELCVHLRTHRRQRPKWRCELTISQCTVCEKKILARNLKRHMAIHGSAVAASSSSSSDIQTPADRQYYEDKLAKCNVCNSEISFKNLKRHMLTIHGEGALEELVLQRRGGRQQGVLTPPPRRGQALCEICGVERCDRESMIVHMRIHSGERPFKCPSCEKTFTANKAMLKHHRRHRTRTTDEGTEESKSIIPIDCKQCSKSFKTRRSMNAHMTLKHTDAGRPFHCNECPLKFKNVSTLDRHMDVHEFRRSKLHCHVCDRKFNSTSGLRRHQTNVHHHEERLNILPPLLNVGGIDGGEPKKMNDLVEQQYFE